MNKPRLSTQTETQIIAMIARGDTYGAIQQAFKLKDESISISTISTVKKRNLEALKYMQGVIVEQSTNQSTKILAKSRELIDRKLDRALKQDDEIAEIKQKFEDGELESSEFMHLLDRATKHELTVTELTSLTREMFNQSQVEQGKPTSISDNPAQAKENLKTLLEAINNKNETAILEAIFDVKR